MLILPLYTEQFLHLLPHFPMLLWHLHRQDSRFHMFHDLVLVLQNHADGWTIGVVRMSDHPYASIHSLNSFHFCFHHDCLTLSSSPSYITAAFTLASGHPGFEIKTLMYSIQYCTVKCTRPQPLVEGAHAWQCMPDMWTNLCDWTCKRKFLSLKAHILKVCM